MLSWSGTLDTKGREYGFLADRIREQDADVLVIDAGILGEPLIEHDVTRQEVAAAAGADVQALADARDRPTAIEAMGRGAAAVVRRLAEGRLDAIGALGGTGGTGIATRAMRALPVGVPKLMVSTVASGDTSPYVGTTDVTMMHSVVDVAGINRILARIFTNAARVLAGLAAGMESPSVADKPVVVASMWGVTTLVARPSTATGLGRFRWVVERTFAWLHRFRRLLVRYERRAESHEAFLAIGCCLICWRRLAQSTS